MDTNLESERESCTELHQILWHIWVFPSILKIFFPELNPEDFKTKEQREAFIKDDANLRKIVANFHNNGYLLENCVVWNYKLHKDAFDRLWIWDNEKDFLVAIINVIKSIKIKELPEITSLEDYIKERVTEIINKRPWVSWIWNMHWGLISETENPKTMDVNWRKVRKSLDWAYFYLDTRELIVVDERTIVQLSDYQLWRIRYKTDRWYLLDNWEVFKVNDRIIANIRKFESSTIWNFYFSRPYSEKPQDSDIYWILNENWEVIKEINFNIETLLKVVNIWWVDYQKARVYRKWQVEEFYLTKDFKIYTPKLLERPWLALGWLKNLIS